MRVALAAMVTGIAIANPNPHVIRDGQDAVATACAEWVRQYPRSVTTEPQCRSEFIGTLNLGQWVIRQTMSKGDARGATMYLDPKTGNMLNWSIAD